jgi:hypothetical protein
METESALLVSFLVTDDRHLGPLRRGKIDMRNPQVVRLESGKAYFHTGDLAEVDTIVFGTGWKWDISFLDKDTVLSKLGLGEDGLWLYRNMLAPDEPGLAFIVANCHGRIHGPHSSLLVVGIVDRRTRISIRRKHAR